jgi:PiT family inorganic phosphate transporter
MELIVLWIVVFLALSFDFINGFHDTANAIATAVSTRALKPRVAIVMAALMNFIGAVTFTGVAATIGKGVANPAELEHGVPIVIAALLSAIAWNLITWWFGIPSSSSHALIGSLAGAVIGGAGLSAINSDGLIKIVKALVISPLLAFSVGFIIMWILKLIFAKSSPHQVNKGFRFGQILTAAFQSFSHGTNDAQKAMGIIVFASLLQVFKIRWTFRSGLSFPQRQQWRSALQSAAGKLLRRWVRRFSKSSRSTVSRQISAPLPSF